MRPRHINPHPLGPWSGPTRGCQDTSRCISWLAHPQWSYNPGLGRECSFRHLPHVRVANGNALPSKPQGNALLLPHPEGMIYRARPSAYLSIPLEKGRVPGLPLDNLEVRG